MRSGESSKRAPVGGPIPRARRSVSGRTSSAETPLSLRTSGVDVTPELDAYFHARLGFRLGKFARHIERLTVRLEDVNGPRGGRDTVCRIKVVGSGFASVVVEEQASDALEAFNRADDRVERAVRRALGRAADRGRLTRTRPPPRERPRRAAAARSDTAPARPSRKSTRKRVDRLPQGNKLRRRQVRRLSSPKAKRARAKRKK